MLPEFGARRRNFRKRLLPFLFILMRIKDFFDFFLASAGYACNL
jgi:hypothetical protein